MPGTELDDGSVSADGKVHVTSIWEFHGITVHGNYSGALTPGGGTLADSHRDVKGRFSAFDLSQKPRATTRLQEASTS